MRHPRITTQEAFDAEIAMMADSVRWPNLYLPVKRVAEGRSGIETGIMHAPEIIGPAAPIVWPGNIFAGVTGERIVYESLAAVVEDGWVVD